MALRADGYDADDLKVLADRALHVALRRRLASGLPSKGAPSLLTMHSRQLLPPFLQHVVLR